MKWFREDKGFTILELMTTLVLFGLVVVGGFRLYYFADRAFSQEVNTLTSWLRWITPCAKSQRRYGLPTV